MSNNLLTAYWITSPHAHAPLGFGVTAYSLDDAIRIIRAFDYGRFLPEDLETLRVVESIRFGDLDHPHVVKNMGPMHVRGLWYPFVFVGLPRWAIERVAIDILVDSPGRGDIV